MDGERRKCPVEPDKAIRFQYGTDEDDYLLIAPSHDSIQVFPESRFNHLRYYDADERQMRMVFLASHLLADLHDMGIPHTRRESISQSEYDGYVEYLGRVSASSSLELELIPDEPLALPAGDPIDAEVQKAHDNLDAEITFYLKEWTD